MIEQLSFLFKDNKCLEILYFIMLIVGGFKITLFIISLTRLLLDLMVFPSKSMKIYGANKGCYALITGSSDGIGKEFAIQLAERGFNLLLISRTSSKLEELKKTIENQYKVKTEILALDLLDDNSANYDAILQLCTNLPITVLVNNVGQSHSFPTPFLMTKEQDLRNIITINNTVTLRITQIVAPIIIENAKKLNCRGLVLTMGSFSGLVPTPLLAVYSGSKAFLQNWSSALAAELSVHNIDVQLVISYLVTSSMSKIKRTSLLVPNPCQFVRSTLSNLVKRVGAQERFATMTPYWSHALLHFAIENFMGVYSKFVCYINYNNHLKISKRALKKMEREAAKNK